jgi:hypothetical protein
MPVEMVFVEKPKSCVKDRHPGKGTPANMLQFACFVQWSHVERDRALPFLVQLTVEDGRVSSIAYN